MVELMRVSPRRYIVISQCVSYSKQAHNKALKLNRRPAVSVNYGAGYILFTKLSARKLDRFNDK